MAELYRNDPTPLYRTLPPAGNPALSSLTAILETMGLQLAIQPIGAQAALQAR
jgi:DNA-binding phage protein